MSDHPVQLGRMAARGIVRGSPSAEEALHAAFTEPPARDAAALERGYASAREVTRTHARSFYTASFLLTGERRRAAFALYAFCRRLDDLVDVEGGVDVARRLVDARDLVTSLYLPSPAAPLRELGWPREEVLALADTVRRFHLPPAPFLELIAGMEMDLEPRRYASFAELERYCYRVAGVVGLLIARVLGFQEPRALDRAVDLGIAMQLTNILRDVKEDAGRGRFYLPQDELAAFNLTEAEVASGRGGDRWTALLRCQIARARGYYQRAATGIPLLRGGRWMVRAMAALYGGILGEIERRAYDVLSGRARVSGSRKLWLLVATLLPRRAPLLPPPIPHVPTLAADVPAAHAGRPSRRAAS